jgi:DNA-binding GntR family transcriptional regulator
MADLPGSDPVYERIRRLIIEGHYAPGARLIESRLARELGVSRTPVRAALARVASEGLVQIAPNRGATVRIFSREDLLNAYDLRSVIEGYAAARAAARITPAQLATLEQAHAALEACVDQQFASREAEVHFLVEHNQRFHQAIIAASGNQRLASLLPVIVDVPLQYRSFYWYTREERGVSNFFHRSIVQALHARDADRARAMMQEHIYRGRDVLLKSLSGMVNGE